jgi:CBS domain-containing membrane protein
VYLILEAMKHKVPISTIMTKNVVKLNVSDNLTKAESLFKKHHIRHIPVVRDKVVIGMLSYTDLLRISFADELDDEENTIDITVYNMFSVEQVMTKNLTTIFPETTIKEAAEILSKNEFHALPVIENGSLVGIVTTTDLIKYLIDQY